jgi:hypothetical protein
MGEREEIGERKELLLYYLSLVQITLVIPTTTDKYFKN